MDILDHDVKEDEYETFVIDRVSRYIYELGLHECKYLLDEKTYLNIHKMIAHYLFFRRRSIS
jgi:hypothetical protein